MEKIRLNKNYVSTEIRGLRVKNNISQIELSKKINIDLIELKKIENGFKMPSLKVIVDVCNYFKITITDFLTFKDIWFAN